MFHIVLIYWIIFPSSHSAPCWYFSYLTCGSSWLSHKKLFFFFLLHVALHNVVINSTLKFEVSIEWWEKSGRKLLLLNIFSVVFWEKIINKIFTVAPFRTLKWSNLIMTANDTSQKVLLFVYYFTLWYSNFPSFMMWNTRLLHMMKIY